MKFVKILFALCISAAILITATPALAANLMPGDKGDDVIALQQALAKKGDYQGDINGLFGSQLEEAIISFQNDNSLAASGIADNQTLAALELYSGEEIKKDAVISINGEKLNLRSKASSDSDVLTELASGTRVQILSTKGSWSLVRLLTGIEGYVSNKYISDDALLEDAQIYTGSMPISTLSEGATGQDVILLQDRLKELNYFSAKSTGNFLSVTVKAVKDFQKANGLDATGIVDLDTIITLFSDGAVKKTVQAVSSVKEESKTPENVPSISIEGSKTAVQIVEYALTFLGTPYRLGANGPNAYDCSSFTKTVYAKYGYTLPRSAYSQGYSNLGAKIKSVSALETGDLVCMNTITDNDLCDHVGIYIGDGKIIHCASGSQMKVVISNLNSSYYKKVFSWGIRIID